jgi:beta-ureidopropionase / N-carbamoyl-L-amino-acid hydrolase
MPVDNWNSILEQIDVIRVMDQLDQIGGIGRLATGGVTRLGFSYEDKTAREMLVRFMQAAGLEITRDPVGNIIGRLHGTQPDAPIIATGSHIDSVINAGKYDGVLGTLAGIECARIINQNAELNSSIEVICFVMEESSRFGAGYGFGSRVMTGYPISDDELQARDYTDKTLAMAIQDLKGWETGSNVNLSDPQIVLDQTKNDISASKRDASRLRSFIELHIEQGPILEKARKKIGVVTGAAAPTRFKITLVGEQNHSGTTPMGLRRDALAAAADAILAVERLSKQNAEAGIVGTVGVISAYPGAINVISGRAEIDVDIRGIDVEAKTETVNAILREIEIICNRRSIDFAVRPLTNQVPITFSNEIIKTIEIVCSKLNISATRLPSGAGHDAAHMAEVTDAGMIFVPSIGGISHDPKEETAIDDIRLGTQVLLATLLRLTS